MQKLPTLLAFGWVLTQTVSSWAAPLDYDSLPEGSIGAVPNLADAPKFVSRGQAAGGFVLALQPQLDSSFAKGGAYAYFQLSANKLDSERMKAASAVESPQDPFEFTSCFQTLPLSSLGSVQGEWPGGGEPVMSMVLQKQAASNPKQAAKGRTRLYAAHVEHWVESADGVALETSDAWIDLGTRGVHVYQSSRLPLVRVAEPYAGVTVYAGRTDHSVEFVVRIRPRDNEHGGQFASQFGTALVITKDNESYSSTCGFVRIGLDADPGQGQTANAVTDVALALDPGDVSKGLGPAGPEPTSPAASREVTLRTLGLNLSVSRLSSDRHPMAAVSYGFVGDERRVSF